MNDASPVTTTRIPAQSLDKAIAYVRSGGRLCIRTAVRATVIDLKTLARFDKAKEWLLKEQGDSYRLRQGRGSVYLLPGQLEAINEEGLRFGASAASQTSA